MNSLAIIGVDEAGRGPLAGPVTAASVLFPADYSNSRIADSKKLSPKVREQVFEEIIKAALAYSIVSVGPRRIEALNIREATRLAMRLSAEKLAQKLRALGITKPLHFLIDGNTPMGSPYSEETVIKGDERIPVISAASILAKVTRDRLMVDLDKRYPGYGLSAHKGYPTKIHKEKVRELGPSRIHRRTFAGVKENLPGF